jgi:hypothetical protein
MAAKRPPRDALKLMKPLKQARQLVYEITALIIALSGLFSAIHRSSAYLR